MDMNQISCLPMFSEGTKSELNPFHFPEDDITTFERHLSSAASADGTTWCAVRAEVGSRSGIDLFRLGGLEPPRKYSLADVGKGANKPVVCAGDSAVCVVWSECERQFWSIKCAVKQQGRDAITTTVVYRSDRALIQPALCWFQGKLWIAWSGFDAASGKMAIFLMPFTADGTGTPDKAVSGRFNAFRPSLAAGPDQILVSCDISHDAVYEIATLLVDSRGHKSALNTLGRANERWMSPAVVCGPDGVFHLAFTVVRDVVDDRYDIVDHAVGAAYARIVGGKAELVPDAAIGDGVLAAWLREGLLGKDVYVPSFGSRRKAFPVVLPDGQVWLAWEFRYEKNKTPAPIAGSPSKLKQPSSQHYDWLAIKRLQDGAWLPTQILYEGGTLYSIPTVQSGHGITVVYIRQFDVAAIPEIFAERIDPAPAKLAPAEQPEDWNRWKPFVKSQYDQRRPSVSIGGETYNLYWADTHTHSILSPDAEGEPDEHLLFGRDIAGLDAMAIVDNDYYPHKALTEGEWCVHKELSRLFTEEGRYVVLPGYEYTFHDRAISPDFNHRYVLYPTGQGELYRRIDPGSRNAAELADRLEGSEGLMFAHHPTWVLTGSDRDRNVEVCSSWRVCIEEKDFVVKRLNAGDQFGFIGSSDTHRAVPGLGGALTGIYARELTAEALMDAYRNRRTFATQGSRIAIDFSVGGLFIGQDGQAGAAPALRLQVTGETPLEFVEIIRDGEVIKRLEGNSLSLAHEFRDQTAAPGRHYYFIRVKAIGDPSYNEPDSDHAQYNVFIGDKGIYRFNFARARGPFAWSTPIWVTIAG